MLRETAALLAQAWEPDSCSHWPAAALPARRAARLNPLIGLREQ